MSKWNDFCKSVKQLTEKAIKKTEEFTDVASLRIKIKTLEGKISEQYENLGALTYSSIKDGSDNKDAVMRITAKIDSYLADIAAYKLKLAKIEEDAKTTKAQKAPESAKQYESESTVEVFEASNDTAKAEETAFPALSEDDDPKLEEAIRITIENQKVSTSMLQRRLEIGYGRAAKIIERMEELGVVGEANGNLPREILAPYKTDAKCFAKNEDPYILHPQMPDEDVVPVRNSFSLPTSDEDAKLIEAVKLAFENQKISTSMLQRNLGIGYGRSAKLIDRMEELGWISVANGNSARAIFVSADELEAIKEVLADQ